MRFRQLGKTAPSTYIICLIGQSDVSMLQHKAQPMLGSRPESRQHVLAPLFRIGSAHSRDTRGWPDHRVCPLCRCTDESAVHLLAQYRCSRRIWLAIYECMKEWRIGTNWSTEIVPGRSLVDSCRKLRLGVCTSPCNFARCYFLTSCGGLVRSDFGMSQQNTKTNLSGNVIGTVTSPSVWWSCRSQSTGLWA
jgi:hypothetical protein